MSETPDDDDEKPKNRGNAGKGRRKGSQNRMTLVAKEAIARAAEGLGGVDGLVAWAKASDDNKRIFWSVIYPKLLPLKVDAEIESGQRLSRVLVWQPPRRS